MPEVANCLTQRMFKGINTTVNEGQTLVPIAFSAKDRLEEVCEDFSPPLRAGSFDASHANGGVMPAVAFALQERAISENPLNGPDGAGFRDDDSAFTLEARHNPQAVAFAIQSGDIENKAQNGIGLGEEEMFSLTARDRHAVAFDAAQITHPENRSGIHEHFPALAGTNRIMAASQQFVRKLTPRECERLQGFPDDFTLVPYRGRMMADGPRYKMIGNSQAVPVIRWIGERIERVEELMRRNG